MKDKLTLRKFIERFLILALIVIAIRGLIYVLSYKFDLRYQYTNSIPGKVYLIIKNKLPRKGGLAAFWPPSNIYYPHTCFIKYVKGVSGDYLKKDGQQFFLNGEFIGEAKKYSQQGTILVPSESGVILKNHYFMWSPHKDSYDSRYKEIGNISSQRIIGTAYRLL